MANTFFTSDLHFGHHIAISYDNRPFTDVNEMDVELIKRWNKKVNPEDTVYILGDLSWHSIDKTIEILNTLNGRKVLIRGNHDDYIDVLNIKDKKEFKCISNCFEEVCDYKEIELNGNKIVLCHYPIHFFNHRFYGGYMFYGHVHNVHEWHYVESFKRDLEALDVPCNMFNVGCMLWNFEPVSFDEIVK